MKSLICRALAPGGAALACALGTSGDVVDRLPPIDLVVELDGCPIDIDPWTCGDLLPLADGTFLFRGQHAVDGLGDVRWSVRYDPDPFVIANVVASNITSSQQTYSITVSLPASLPGPTLIGGSLVGQFCDGSGDGAAFSAPGGGAIYTALFDGVAVAGGGMLPDPFQLSVGPYECLPIGPVEFGSPIPSAPAGLVEKSIGITLSFVLTAYDTASCMSIFVVEPAPALPAAGSIAEPTSNPLSDSMAIPAGESTPKEVLP